MIGLLLVACFLSAVSANVILKNHFQKIRHEVLNPSQVEFMNRIHSHRGIAKNVALSTNPQYLVETIYSQQQCGGSPYMYYSVQLGTCLVSGDELSSYILTAQISTDHINLIQTQYSDISCQTQSGQTTTALLACYQNYGVTISDSYAVGSSGFLGYDYSSPSDCQTNDPSFAVSVGFASLSVCIPFGTSYSNYYSANSTTFMFTEYNGTTCSQKMFVGTFNIQASQCRSVTADDDNIYGSATTYPNYAFVSTSNAISAAAIKTAWVGVVVVVLLMLGCVAYRQLYYYFYPEKTAGVVDHTAATNALV